MSQLRGRLEALVRSAAVGLVAMAALIALVACKALGYLGPRQGPLEVRPAELTIVVGAEAAFTASYGSVALRDSVHWFVGDSTIFMFDARSTASPHRATGRGRRVGRTSISASVNNELETAFVNVVRPVTAASR